MPVQLHPVMRSAMVLLRLLIVLNFVALAFVVLLLAASLTSIGASTLAETQPEASVETFMLSFRAAMAIAILTVPFAHLLLTRLRNIVETARAGDPFVPSNARQLNTIAWCLLALQVLDLGFGAVSLAADEPFVWNFSLTGWIAVVLLFVLAKVFEHGTTMRDELAGTV